MITILESLDPLPPDCILVTFDVESLYTNVPHDEGIQALGNVLQLCNANSSLTIALQHWQNWYSVIIILCS